MESNESTILTLFGRSCCCCCVSFGAIEMIKYESEHLCTAYSVHYAAANHNEWCHWCLRKPKWSLFCHFLFFRFCQMHSGVLCVHRIRCCVHTNKFLIVVESWFQRLSQLIPTLVHTAMLCCSWFMWVWHERFYCREKICKFSTCTATQCVSSPARDKWHSTELWLQTILVQFKMHLNSNWQFQLMDCR